LPEARIASIVTVSHAKSAAAREIRA
jgi:hypothetical protein